MQRIVATSNMNNVAGERVKAFREKYGLSQTGLGTMLGVARNTVTRWETGEMKVPSYLLLALAELGRRITEAQTAEVKPKKK